MKKPHILAAGALAFLLPHATFAQDAVAAPAPEGGVNPAQEAQPPAVEAKDDDWLTLGGDFRARYESFDHVPVAGPIGDYWSYFRFRTRVFAKIDTDNFAFQVRAVNEWRKFHNRHGRNSYPFADEFVLDLLYAELRNDAFGFPMRLRVGRQEIMDLGSQRVLGEGTAGDGSRTFSFNAARLTLTPVEKLDIDVLGIYNRWHDVLAIRGFDSDFNSIPNKKRDLNGNRSDESGAGVYLTDRRDKDFGYEAYYLWKHETKDARGRVAGGQGRDTHTLGARLLPKFNETLSGELEAAGQLGRTEDHRAIHAYMLHAGLTQTFEPSFGLTPYVSGAATVFSGDKNEAAGHISGWNPVWGRLPQYGDLSGMVFPGMSFWYQNLIYPHVELGFYKGPRLRGSSHYVRFQTGPMFAQRVNGSDVSNAWAGDSRYRGWHFFSQYGVPIISKPCGVLKSLTAMVEADCILPGDYYNQSEPVYFLRLQLQAAF